MQLLRSPLEINTCSAVGVYFSQQIQILHTKHFFVYQLGKEQKSPVIFKGTLVSAITLHMYAFSIQQTVMFVYGSTDDHMFDGMSKMSKQEFVHLTRNVLYIKNELVENLVNFLSIKTLTS